MIPKPLTQKLIHELLAVTEIPCISLYMSTHRSHPENIQDIIHFKNLMKQVNETLSQNYSTAEIQKLMEPLEALISDNQLWNHTANALAVFCSSELFEVISLQEPVEELAIVADTFHTRPLRRSLQSSDRYQVLGLSLDAIHLYEGNRHTLVEVEFPVDFPSSMTEALGNELTEKHSTVASYGGVGGDSANMHHGHGGEKDELEIDTERFFRSAATAVYENYSKPTGLPLILAALPEHHHLFRKMNKNPLLHGKGIEINPTSVTTEELSHLVWDVMEPVYLQRLESLADKFNQAKANKLGSDVIEEVIEAAEAGRVETLFIEAHRVIARRLRNINGTYKVIDVTQPKLDDLFDDIGELVGRMGGTVLIIPKENMPTQTGLAAIFRY
ncbi:MAG: hypothetical protein JJE09_11330 [Bacteroidia bacterium]|nr:hypothetical protein [Bacteroidia bacterium]